MALRDIFAGRRAAECFSDRALLSAMLEFERTLALAQADVGLVPAASAATIARCCVTARFDLDALVAAARRAGTLAIPLVKQLTAEVAAADADAARYVHWGSTSQDVADTALALQSRQAACALLEDLGALGGRLAELASRHRDTPMVGRTLLQAAAPISFGWKAAVWLAGVARTRRALEARREALSVLQLGGATGTLASLGGDGMRVAEAMARRLDLRVASTSWHAMRDEVARMGCELGVACGVLGKIGRDLSLLAQTEVGEIVEPSGEGRGGSSALPHKRNPVASMTALEASLRAPALAATLLAELTGEHERGLGHWQSQWWTLGELFGAAGSAAEALVEASAGLVVDVEAMAANLARTRGLAFAEAVTMALAADLGKARAQALMESLCRQAIESRSDLAQVLAADPTASAILAPGQIASLFEPSRAFGSAGETIDRVLADWAAIDVQADRSR